MRKKLLYGLMLLLFVLPVQMRAQNTRISLNLTNVPLNSVLNEIEAKTEYTFLVNQRFVDLTRRVNAVYTDATVKEILEQLFKDEKVSIVLSDHQIILAPLKEDQGKPKTGKTVKGKVTDSETHEPLPGVTVVIKGTTTGTTTSMDGYFSIEVPKPDGILVFSMIGYSPREVSMAEVTGELNLELLISPKVLNEIVVTALGVKREEKALGYSVQKTSGETLKTIKGAELATTLTGKVAGLLIRNSSNFGTSAGISLRGEKPLIVVDGVPSSNMSLDDLAQDDIESIDFLKGATASALYGYRGAGGAIMITTSRGAKDKQGLSVSVNSSTMLNLGFVVTPDRQTSYSSGYGGKYGDDYIWGDKLDIGRTTSLWDPVEMVWKDSVPLVSKGKDNLKNFQELGLITNNNVNIASKGEHSTFRTSISHIFNKGQFPNQKLDKVIYSVGGEMSFNNLSVESNFNYVKHVSPNIHGSQYSGGYLYNLIGWLGAEWDILEYKNYWMVKDEQQNWFNNEWYDNPYFLANEVIQTADRDIMNGFVNATYKFTPWLWLTLRSGLDSYINRYTYRNPISARNAFSYYGYYEDQKYTGYSVNNDLLLFVDKSFKDFKINGMAGGTIYSSKNDYFDASTNGGISIPGYYSLKASKDPIEWNSWLKRRQVNSLYARTTTSWKGLVYLDLTGRWDWSSTLSKEANPYFYPSIAGSFIPSELIQNVKWLDFWKIRGSWTMSKSPADIYDIRSAYVVENEVWSGYNAAYYPTSLKTPDVRPQAFQTYEFGTATVFMQNKIRFDLTLFSKRSYDYLVYADFSEATGFYNKYLNTNEERTQRGMEIILGGTPVNSSDWKWDINVNWSKAITRYTKIDDQFTPDESWIKVGNRVDAFAVTDWIRDPDGNLVNTNGFPTRSDYSSVIGYSDPDWIWGLNSTLKYKNFALSCSFDGRVGGRSFSRLDALFWNSGAHIETDNQYRYDEVVNGLKNYIGPGVKVVSGEVTYDSYGNITSDTRVFAPNDVEVSYESYVKDHYQKGAWSWCSQNIMDETFFKLREISLIYTIPKKLGDKMKLKNPSIALIGQNLFFWGKEYKLSDPDYGYTWDLVSPSIRYVGINIKFNI